MQLLRAEARRTCAGARGPAGSARTPAGSARTPFPSTPVNRPVPVVPARGLHSPRARAWLPLLLAPVTVSLAAVIATSIGLSAFGVLLVAIVVAVVGGLIAHRAAGRLVTGAVLVVARPFAPGDRVRVYVPELGRTADAELLRIGPLTTTLCTDSGVLVVPTGELLRPPPA